MLPVHSPPLGRPSAYPHDLARQNRDLSRGVNASGGEVPLDQQVEPQDPGGFGERNRT